MKRKHKRIRHKVYKRKLKKRFYNAKVVPTTRMNNRVTNTLINPVINPVIEPPTKFPGFGSMTFNINVEETNEIITREAFFEKWVVGKLK